MKGQGGHGSEPASSIDPITAACYIHQALHTIKSRKIFNHDVVAFTICELTSGSTNNVIPENAYMQGTIRYFSKEDRDKLEEFIKKIAINTAEAHGCEAKLEFTDIFAPTVNHEKQTEIVKQIALKELGENSVNDSKGLPVMGSEDFSFYMNLIPGCFFFVNNIQEGQPSLSLHDSNYQFNDRIISTGAFMYVKILENRFGISLV